MAEDEIQRWKDPADFTASEFEQRLRDPHIKIEREEYRHARREALRAAGLEPEEESAVPYDDMSREQKNNLSAEDYLRHLQGDRR